ILLAHVLGQSRAWLFAWPESDVDEARAAHFARLIAARARGEPIAYLTGRRAFWSLDLEVGSGVLIPRPETELLVELALARMPADSTCAVADLGTGSGAIALALARERPRARVLATDASGDALSIARANAKRLVIGNVTFAQGDWCDALGDQRYDLLVSNPPYIALDDPHLREGDLRYEPASALSSGVDGLDAIRRIVAAAPEHLHPRGTLLLEHGWDQAARVRALLDERGFVAIETARDTAGHERITIAQRAS
ncbi:MAG: peptide chain release factor N(5)-glutamine methyltransferase, partial [Dokdonella sp.]|uniref:peptide chain release factor N(5)-glutamine methyltransferase n=1 Tax=Dokdonella sp. TaxID=2291710 RepID=UPI003265D8DF